MVLFLIVCSVSTLFFHLWVVYYGHFYLLLCVFSVCVSDALMFPKDISPSARVPQSCGFVNVACKCWLGYRRIGPKLSPPCWRSGPQLSTSETYTSKLTSSCSEQRRFSLCVRIHRRSNPTAHCSEGVSQPFTAGSVSLSFNSSFRPKPAWGLEIYAINLLSL